MVGDGVGTVDGGRIGGIGWVFGVGGWRSRRPRTVRPETVRKASARGGPWSGGGQFRSDVGAVAVEAAIVLPLLIAVLLGLIETAMLLRAGVGLSSAVRSAARTASAEPRQESFAIDAVEALARAGTGVALTQINEVWVYRANQEGYPGADGVADFSAGCATACLRFRFDPVQGRFVPTGGNWPAATIDACMATAQSVGVRVQARHVPMTAGLIGERTLSQRAVMRFEPLVETGGRCRP